MMKKFLIFSVAAVCLFGCAEQADVENLQKQIDELKSDQIASVNAQLASINSSITNLVSMDSELKGYISTLQSQAEDLTGVADGLAQSISELKTEVYNKVSSEKASILQELENQRATIQDQINAILSQIAGLEAKDASLAEKDEDLQEQIDQLKETLSTLQGSYDDLTTRINTLETALMSEISDAEERVLIQLDAYKTSVDSQLQAINQTIAALQAKDQDLQTQIDNLTAYVDSGINSAKDWVSATFVTLEMFNQTADIIAGIQAQIETINTTLVSLENTYAGITSEDLDAAISGLDESLQSLISQTVSDCNDALTTARQEITAAYTTAIQEAITSSESAIKAWVNNQLARYYTIAQTDEKLSALKTSLETQLTNQKSYLEGMISSLEASLTKDIEANEALINGFQAQIDGLNSDLSNLTDDVISNGRTISKNSGDIATNAKSIATNASNIDECERLIAANKRLIEENSAAIEDNASAIRALQSQATTDEQDIATNARNIAQNASDIAANAALISANATAISNNARAISDNAADIVQLRSDLSTARTEITTAYQQAISAAITTYDGQLRGELATEVSTINTRIDNEIAAINTALEALTTRVSTCEKDIKNIKNTLYSIQQEIDDIHDQITAILARIQSITYVPTYSDGKAVMSYTDNGTLTPGTAALDFKLQPAETAAAIVQVWQSALHVEAVYTQTKSAPETVALTITSATAENGYLSITVSGAGLSEDFFRSRCSVNAALIISDSNNELASEYIPLIPWTTDVISFGDEAFKAYCVEQFDSDGDGELTEEEAEAATTISASMLGINSLVGIEYFSNLEHIDVSYNKLTSLDLSHSPKLKTVDVSGNKLKDLNLDGLSQLENVNASNNKLTALEISESPALASLNCNNNQIGALNLLKNKALTELLCNSNNLQTLNLKNNTLIETLYCRKNEISVLDVSKLTALKELDCSQNALSSLNLSQNPELEFLYCASNQLTSLGISANTKLTYLDCQNNSITALDLSMNVLLETLNCSNNQLARLDISENPNLETLTCTGNPNMAKLWVKDAAQAAALSITKEDFTVIAYNDGGIVIPDANLKSYLLALFDDDEDGEISILEAENVENVNCFGRSIADLTGLEMCPNLKCLNFNGNNVTAIELPNLHKLESIIAYGNPISRININNDVALTSLYLQDENTNALSGLSVTIDGFSMANTLYLAFAGTTYTELYLTNSSALTSYDISENIQLTKLVACNNPNVTSVNLASLTNLAYLDLNACGLTELNIDTNIALDTFDCSSNSLSSLNVDNNTLLVTFDCSDNNLSTLRVTNNIALDMLDCSANNLQNINVRNNTVLKTLNVSSNIGITALALWYNTILETLNVSGTGLTDLEVSNNPNLKYLDISDSSIASLLLSNDTLLSVFKATSTPFAPNSSMFSALFNHLSLYSAIGDLGVVIQDNDKYFKILSSQRKKLNWPDAINWCEDIGGALPSCDEWNYVISILDDVNDSFSAIGATPLSGKYWSNRTDLAPKKGLIVPMDGSPGTWENSSALYYVRAIIIIYK